MYKEASKFALSYWQFLLFLLYITLTKAGKHGTSLIDPHLSNVHAKLSMQSYPRGLHEGANLLVSLYILFVKYYFLLTPLSIFVH